jgi:hypothetical protein
MRRMRAPARALGDEETPLEEQTNIVKAGET